MPYFIKIRRILLKNHEWSVVIPQEELPKVLIPTKQTVSEMKILRYPMSKTPTPTLFQFMRVEFKLTRPLKNRSRSALELETERWIIFFTIFL